MNDWIEWSGGSYDADPAGERMVEIKFRNGGTDTDRSDRYYWSHDDDDSDIVAYRIVETNK